MTTVVLILGGGRGTRLYPLTKMRSKPAVPIGGKYRLIDIPVSNCLHAGLNRIFILTQFMSQSLNRHINRTYSFGPFSHGFCEILAAQQTLENSDWYQGTADAVRQNLGYVVRHAADNCTLILSGDQLYRMDFAELQAFHEKHGAQITIAAKPVFRREARDLGILQVDSDGRIIRFAEKPRENGLLDELCVDESLLRGAGIEPGGREHLASMGIYLFETSVLDELLSNSDETDFGREVIPRAICEKRVFAFLFDGYWEDVGTIGAFHRANLDLAADVPAFNFYDERKPVYSRARFLPASKIIRCHIDHAVIADGCIVRDSEIFNSVIGLRSVIGENAIIRSSVVMGADFYSFDRRSRPPYGIGRGCIIENAIIDKNALIGDGAQIVNRRKVEREDGPNYVIRDGIVVVPKNAVIEPGTVV